MLVITLRRSEMGGREDISPLPILWRTHLTFPICKMSYLSLTYQHNMGKTAAQYGKDNCPSCWLKSETWGMWILWILEKNILTRIFWLKHTKEFSYCTSLIGNSLWHFKPFERKKSFKSTFFNKYSFKYILFIMYIFKYLFDRNFQLQINVDTENRIINKIHKNGNPELLLVPLNFLV